ncbi:hypothetical protein M0R19_06070 [Candidatus Pacearchaeota archaeon]|jgi:ribosomal protein L40E|nr:hypothetical protein [Candidatus Pacearchaeota archaeon]
MFKNAEDLIEPSCPLFGMGWDRKICRDCIYEDPEQWQSCREFTLLTECVLDKKNIRKKKSANYFEEEI